MTDSSTTAPMGVAAPIGVFDSGVGGLSVLRHLRAQLPQADFLYFADTAFAPYGEKTEAEVIERSLAATQFLRAQGAVALVVACNTATAAAIDRLRATWPDMPIVGVEPGLKPGAAQSKNGKIGVLATAGTLASARFARLLEKLEVDGRHFFLVACNGLADQIEKGELRSPATRLLLQRYVAPLLAEGVDTLVLGCTHYPFVRPLIEEIAGPQVHIIDTGEAVARQLARRLHDLPNGQGTLRAYSSGSKSAMEQICQRLLDMHVEVHAMRPGA